MAMAPSSYMSSDAPAFPFSMRFASRELEAGFADSRRALLVRRMKVLAAMHLLASVCPLAYIFAVQAPLGEGLATEAAKQCIKAHAAGQGFMAAYMIIVLSTSRLWEALCNTLVLEVFTIFSAIVSMAVMTFTGPKRFARVLGYDLMTAFGDDYDTDSGILLVLDILVTATHLGLPVRWFVMAPLEAAALLSYGLVAFFVGSAETPTDVAYNMLALLTLVSCSALGKRTAELEERRSFSAMICEKTLRCHAEHQLSNAAAERLAKGESSSTVTDRSGAIFEPLFEKGGNCSEQLRLVAEKGDSEHWRIKASEVKLLNEEVLGSGSFGSVQRAVFCGTLVAVKQPHLGRLRLPQLCNELRVLRHLRHPNIVATHGAVVLPEEQMVCLVLELIEGADLRHFLLAGEQPSVFMRYQVMQGVCQALVYMHTRKPHLVHGDLKDSNVLVSVVNGCAFPKVLDFGLSRVKHAHSRVLGGTLAWMAPEVLDHAPVHCSADVYSFGHVLAFAATGVPPQGRRCMPPLWPPPSSEFAALEPLVSACLQQQQRLRPGIARAQAQLLALANELPLRSSSEQPSEMKRALEEKRARCAAYIDDLGLIAKSLAASSGLAAAEPAAEGAGLAEPLALLPEESAVSIDIPNTSSAADAGPAGSVASASSTGAGMGPAATGSATMPSEGGTDAPYGAVASL